MIHSIYRFCLIFSLCICGGNKAQAQFFLNGSAIATNDSCYQLTSEENWLVGSIWNGDKINLNQSFEVAVDLFLGCKDNEGADGIVFGLQPISTSIGEGGGDLGIGNVAPSLGVEFDTYQNIDYDDPVYDHIAIIQDGIVRHNQPLGALAGPIQANLNEQNIEDCEYHPIKISWDASAQTLSVSLDCELRLTYTGDIVNEIFNGDPEVFWGFTSATGGLNNIQTVCFSYTTFLDALADQTICPGESVPLEANGGLSYQWSPTEGLSDPNIANPIASPDETTLYTVEILDNCGLAFYDEVLITVDNEQFSVSIDGAPSNATVIQPCTEFSLYATVDPPGEDSSYVFSWSSVIESAFSNTDSIQTQLTSSVTQTGTETISVQVTSENGCQVTSNFSFNIEGSLYDIPNVFTPNSDGVNDTFGLISKGPLAISEYDCKIFDRWGTLVFESTNPEQSWDGNYKDKAVSPDVFVYIINFEIGGQKMEETGDLTLIR